MSPAEKRYREMSDTQIKKAANDNLNTSPFSATDVNDLEVMIEDVIKNRKWSDNEIKKTFDMSQKELEERRN